MRMLLPLSRAPPLHWLEVPCFGTCNWWTDLACRRISHKAFRFDSTLGFPGEGPQLVHLDDSDVSIGSPGSDLDSPVAAPPTWPADPFDDDGDGPGSADVLPGLEPRNADEGFHEDQLAVWRRVEASVGCPIGPVQVQPRMQTVLTPSSLPGYGSGAAFLPCSTFAGALDGYVFTTRTPGTGYYLSQPVFAPFVLLLAPLVAPPAAAAFGALLADVAPVSRRARRQRLSDGTRVRRRRRKPTTSGPLPPVLGHTTLAEASWRQAGLWAIDTANPNSWTTAERTVLASSAADILLLQETKRLLDCDRPAALASRSRRLGWNLQSSPALLTEFGRASGGTAVAARRGIGVNDQQQFVRDGFEHRVHFAWICGVLRGGVHLGSVWMKDSEGASATNLAILGAITEAISALRGPWVLGGDWNMSPEELVATGWPLVVDGVVVAPGLPTCHDKVYDYFVVSRGLAHAVVGIQRVEDAGFSPHWPTRLLLRGDARRLQVRQLSRPRLVPASLPMGPLPQPIVPHHPADLDETAMDQYMMDWLVAARGEWHSLLGDLPPFIAPRFRWAPAPGPRAEASAGSTWEANAWRQLAMRVSELDGLLGCGTARARAIVARHLASATALVAIPGSPPGFAAVAAPWLVAALSAALTRDRHGVAATLVAARSQAAALERASRAAARREWTAWLHGTPVQAGRARGAPTKRAFQFIRAEAGWARSPLGDPRYDEAVLTEQRSGEFMDVDSDACTAGCHGTRLWQPSGGNLLSRSGDVQPLSDQAAVEAEADRWAALWAEGCQYRDVVDPSGDPPAALTAAELRAAALTFPPFTGVGADNIAPRALARLSDELLVALGLLLVFVERVGRWPACLHLVLIVLLAKPDGGRRPIGLFPTVIRVWMRARSSIARQWELDHARPGVYGGAGRGAQRAAWQIAMRAEASACDGMHYAQALLDLVKAFETIPHHRIVEAAIRHGYCLWTLRLSLAAYCLPRVLGIDGAFSRTVLAVLGITAGSGFATTELRVLLLDVIDAASRAWPQVTLSLYVDDATLESWDQSQFVVARRVAGAVDQVVTHMEGGLALQVSVSKSVVAAGTMAMARRVAARSTTRRLTAVRAAKVLGAPSGGGRRRSIQALRVRTTAFAKRVPRMRLLGGAGFKVASLVRASGTPMATYGVEVCGMGDSHLHRLRSLIARAAAPQAGGKNPDLVLHLADAAGGGLDPAVATHVLPISTWALACWQAWHPAESMAAALAHAQSRVLIGGTVCWRRVAGPAAAVVATAARIGWAFGTATQLHTDDGMLLDLLLDPPAVIKEQVALAVGRWRLRRIAEAAPDLIPAQFDFECTVPADPGRRQEPAREALIDVTDVVASLASCAAHRRARLPVGWEHRFGPYLASAFTGGQWPQARLAAVPRWDVDDDRCQLCFGASGTLAHRLQCPAVVPAGGWPLAEEPAEQLALQFDARRRELLETRGLLVLRLRVPPPPAEEDFRWLQTPPEDMASDAVWYIDGSLFDEARRFARRAGFGIVVVSSDGVLLAYGLGTPPGWIRDAAGAEAWAYFVAVRSCPGPPIVVTDCLGILNTLAAGLEAATAPSRKLARVWSMISAVLEGCELQALERLSWMPAHTSEGAIGHALDSRGRRLTPVAWRANRLVDALAKTAASPARLPQRCLGLVAAATDLVRNRAARIGMATFGANHFEQDGRIHRDSVTGSRPPPRRQLSAAARLAARRLACVPPRVATPARTAAAATAPQVRLPAGARLARSAWTTAKAQCLRRRLAKKALAAVAERRQVAGYLARLRLAPATAPSSSAAARLAALRGRVRAREGDLASEPAARRARLA